MDQPQQPEPQRFHPGTDPLLHRALSDAIARAEVSGSAWRHSVIWVLRRRRFRLARLNGAHGLNPLGPFLPLVLIDEDYFRRASPGQLCHTLLHEALHQCFVVWPEWKLWINWLGRSLLPRRQWKDPQFTLFPYNSIYGPGVNSADSIAAELMRSADERKRDP